MKRFLILTLLAAPITTYSGGITNGIYEIRYRFSDAASAQEVTIANCVSPSPSIIYFDVVIDKNGGLKRRDQDKQIVRGLVHIDTFTFIIPFVSGSTISAYTFTGANSETEGTLVGQGSAGSEAFHFWMKRKGT